MLLMLHTFAAGIAGLLGIWHIAAWKLSTESIDSPNLITRWIYRYLVFSFWLMFSFLLIAPLTTWQLTKLPEFQAVLGKQSWTLTVLAAIPVPLLYYLYRKFVIWCDPAKVKARNKLRAQALSQSGR